MEPAKKCPAVHTKYQPPDADFKCPKCGAAPSTNTGAFYIVEPCEGSLDECGLLHADDVVGCDSCGFGSSGKAFAARLSKAANMVPCPTCKGHGVVKGE